MSKIFSDTILIRDPSLISSEIDGEVVMLSIRNGEYYQLNKIGSTIWQRLENKCTFSDLLTSLLEQYSVSEAKCIQETKTLLESFINKGIIEIKNE